MKIMYYFSLETNSRIRFKKYIVKIENAMKLLYVYMGHGTNNLYPIPYDPRGPHTRLPEQYACWTPSISPWASKTVLTQTHNPFWYVICEHIGVGEIFCLVGVWVLNFACSLSLCEQTDSMSRVDMWHQENWRQVDFYRPRYDVKFDNNAWDGECQRGIDFFCI